MYDVIFDDKVTDILNKLEKDIKIRIFKKVTSSEVKENPLRYFERLEGRKGYKLRVGDYRIIADIDTSKKRIAITLAGHRKKIYKILKRQ